MKSLQNTNQVIGLPGLRAAMAAKNLSLSKLAAKMDSSSSTIWKLASGRAGASTDFLTRLVAILDCSADELLGLRQGK